MRRKQRGGESLQVWQKQGSRRGEEASGFLGERGAEEEDWRRDRRDEQARAQQRKGRLGVEGKQGASGRGKEEKRVSGRRQKRKERGNTEEGTRGRVTGTEASRGGGGGGGGLAGQTERAGAERGRFWICETDKRDGAGEVTQRERRRGSARRGKERGAATVGVVAQYTMMGLYYPNVLSVSVCLRTSPPLQYEKRHQSTGHRHWALSAN